MVGEATQLILTLGTVTCRDFEMVHAPRIKNLCTTI